MPKQTNKPAILPNMAAFVREVTEYGNIGAMARRVLKLGLHRSITLAWWNKTEAMRILKKDFGVGMRLLLQMELLTTPTSTYVAISDQVIDLAVAMKNTCLIEGLVKDAKRAGYQPILMTNNLSHLLHALRDTRVKDVLFSFPRNKANEVYEQILEPARIYPHELLA